MTEGRTPLAHIITYAVDASRLSPCRSRRGVAIFRGDDLIAVGYNQKPIGFDCDGSLACKATCRTEAIHAEQAALLLAGPRARGCELLHVKTDALGLVASGGPSCVQCSKLILAAGIVAVWLYETDGWHRYEAAEFHRLSLSAALAAVPAQPAQDAGCINCGEAKAGGYMSGLLGSSEEGDVGPFCAECWRKLQETFCAAVPPALAHAKLAKKHAARLRAEMRLCGCPRMSEGDEEVICDACCDREQLAILLEAAYGEPTEEQIQRRVEMIPKLRAGSV